ncbi:MAG: D-arabinono-1,4-lactone oxidase [Chitinophagales bacterium]
MSLESKLSDIVKMSNADKQLDELSSLIDNETEDFEVLDDSFIHAEVNIASGAVFANQEFKLSAAIKLNNPCCTWHFVHDVRIISPQSLTGTVNVVRWAEQKNQKIRAIGSCHSFSTVAQTDDCYVSMKECTGYDTENFKGDIDQHPLILLKSSIDKDQYVNIPAGLKIESVNHILQFGTASVKGNRRLFNMGGGDVQAFAGAFSTGTHGSGGIYSTYHDTVRSLVLVASGGRVFRIEPTNGITDVALHKEYFQQHPTAEPIQLIQDDDVFYSAVVSMGCFGIIYSCIIEVMPFTLLHEDASYIKGGWLTEIKNRIKQGMLPSNMEEEKFIYIQLNPYKIKAGKTLSIMLKETFTTKDAASGKKDTRRKLWPQVFANSKLSVKFIRNISNNSNLPRLQLIEAALKNQNDNKQHGGGFTDACYKVWNSGSGKLKTIGSGIEFAFPVQQIPEVIDTITSILQHEGPKGRGFFLNSPIALRFVRPSKVYLAPNYATHLGQPVKEWCYIEILRVNSLMADDDKRELELFEYLQTMLKIMKGRPHWGLNFKFGFDESMLSEFYPKFDEWLKTYIMLNSSGVFDNEFTRTTNLREAAKRKFPVMPLLPVVI